MGHLNLVLLQADTQFDLFDTFNPGVGIPLVDSFNLTNETFRLVHPSSRSEAIELVDSSIRNKTFDLFLLHPGVRQFNLLIVQFHERQ